MIYYLIPLLLYLTFLCRSFNRELLFFLTFILVCIIIIVGGLRDSVGSDWYAYYDIFKSSQEKVEVGFQYLITSIKYFDNNNYYLFVFCIFALSILLKIYFFYKLSSSVLICLIVYMGSWFLVFDINQIRQGLSLGFVCIALCFCYNKKIIPYCIFLFLAFMVHTSSIVIFPFYFLVNCKIKKKYMFCIVCVLFIFSMYGMAQTIVDKLTNIFNLDSRLIQRLYDYSEDERYNSNILLSFSTIHRFLVFLITLFFVDKIHADERVKKFILISAFYYICIYLIFSQFELIALRLSTYYKLTEFIFFSYLPFISNKIKMQNLIALVILIYVFLQVNLALQISNGGLLPYFNLFEVIF